MTIRLAYMHRSFPGVFGSLVGFAAAQELATSVFLAERWARDAHFAGVRKARIPGPDPEQAQKTGRQRTAESLLGEMARSAARAGDTLLRLRKGGFAPHILYATAEEGYLLYAKDIFPKTRLVVRLGNFYNPEMLHEDNSGVQTGGHPCSAATLGRIQNCFMLSALNDASVGIVTSEWQKRMFSSVCGFEKIHIVPGGVDTRLFSPARTLPQAEVVTFSCQGLNPARGIQSICACLPLLLAQRPHCRARILSFAPARSEGARQLHEEALRALLPPLSDEQLHRLEIVISPAQSTYVDLLRDSTAYVYLTSPTMLSAGILEAMSCGALIIASATGPVRELIRHGENGILCQAEDGASLADTVAQTLANAADMTFMRRNARQTVLDGHDLRKLLPQHAALVLE